MKVDLPSEVWVIVLGFLRNPITPPLSNPVRSRSTLQQPNLCAAARTCKVSPDSRHIRAECPTDNIHLFKSICDTLLYSNLIVVDLPTLLVDIHTPSKRRLLALVQTLHIEYRPKAQHPTYLQLLSNSGTGHWRRYGLMKKSEKKAARIEDCDAELVALLPTLERLCDLGMRTVFPKLEKVVIASMCKKENQLWMLFRWAQTRGGAGLNDLTSCTTLFDKFVSSGNLQHLCVRDATAPLAPNPNTSFRKESPSNYSLTIHYDGSDIYMPISFGGPTRWVSDIAPDKSWAEEIHFTGVSLASYPFMPGIGKSSDALDLEIFCSTSIYGTIPPHAEKSAPWAGQCLGPPMLPLQAGGPALSAERQATMAEELGSRAQDYYRLHRRSYVSVQWSSSAEMPMCPGCGSGPPK